ncbi:MAG: S-methyl-5-thioribose-1-phosphate isomerase [Conexivisphaerales archaeon]
MKPILWEDNSLSVLDQRLLPSRKVWRQVKDAKDAHDFIKSMVVRGAPLIGVVAAFGVALEAGRSREADSATFRRKLVDIADSISLARPTAVNLAWAAQRVSRAAGRVSTVKGMKARALEEAIRIMEEEKEMSTRIGENGASLIKDGDTILTHCNAGALATVGLGTALAPVRTAVAQGKNVKVFATETRPALQGARLTTFELMEDHIDVTLICDTMVGSTMSKGLVDEVFLGADRVLADGTVYNKIGTYQVAVLAKRHYVPFYSAFPRSTFDLTSRADQVKIEERDSREVTMIRGRRIAPRGVKVLNPAFDATPAELVTAYVTDRGIEHPPFEKMTVREPGRE